MLACQLSLLVPWLLLLQLRMEVLARHAECSWKPTPGAPAPLGYRPYCSAKLINAQDYQCNGKVGVADFGKKSGGVLEWRESRAARETGDGLSKAHPRRLALVSRQPLREGGRIRKET